MNTPTYARCMRFVANTQGKIVAKVGYLASAGCHGSPVARGVPHRVAVGHGKVEASALAIDAGYDPPARQAAQSSRGGNKASAVQSS